MKIPNPLYSIVSLIFLIVNIFQIHAQNIKSDLKALDGKKITTFVDTHGHGGRKLNDTGSNSTDKLMGTPSLTDNFKFTWLSKFNGNGSNKTLITTELKNLIVSVNIDYNEQKYNSDQPAEVTDQGEMWAGPYIGILKKEIISEVNHISGLTKVLAATNIKADSSWKNRFPVFDTALHLNMFFFPAIISSKVEKNQIFTNLVVLKDREIRNVFTVLDVNQNVITLKFNSNALNTNTSLRETLKKTSSMTSFTKEEHFKGTLVINALTFIIESEDYNYENIFEVINSGHGDFDKHGYSAVSIKNMTEAL